MVAWGITVMPWSQHILPDAPHLAISRVTSLAGRRLLLRFPHIDQQVLLCDQPTCSLDLHLYATELQRAPTLVSDGSSWKVEGDVQLRTAQRGEAT